jgi:hypothetical protein
MVVHRSRLMKPLTAVMLIGSFALWRPAVMACMDAMPGMDSMPGMGHTAQQHGTPQHVPQHDCCGVCPCTIAPSLATPLTPSPSVALEVACASSDWARFIPVLAVPHFLPFSVGPPLQAA